MFSLHVRMYDIHIVIQWNPFYKRHRGERKIGLYREVSLSQGLIHTQKGTLGHYNVAFIEGVSLHQGWLLRGVPLYIVEYILHHEKCPTKK